MTEKKYLAVVDGIIQRDQGTVRAPIGRPDPDEVERWILPADKGGFDSVTHYKVLQRYSAGYTLVEVSLETGRTHQIRVHFAFLGHPLAGDDLYGGTRGWITRQALHCGLVRFIHPVTGEQVCLKAHLPPDMTAVLRIQ